MGKKALVFGASGVTGWSFINELLHDYPRKGLWDGVAAMTNRPLKQEDSLWPADSRLQIVSGVDLLDDPENVECALKEKVRGVHEITHVYYLAYKAGTDMQKELEEAVHMFKASTIAMNNLSSALEFVVLQTGAKMYGCHLLENHPTDYIHIPLSEDQPRLRAPYHDMLFYHSQLDWMTEFAKDKRWSWCDTRPDIIVGFVPTQNFYSSHDSSSDMIARQTIHLSLKLPESMKGDGFNVADAKDPSAWSEKWPTLCSYFGLKGTGPLEIKDGEEKLEVRKYINDHIDTWKELEKEHGLKSGVADSDLTFKGFEYFLMTQFDFDRQYDMTKMYSTPKDDPFSEQRSTMEAWGLVFDRMREGRLIPTNAKADA